MRWLLVIAIVGTLASGCREGGGSCETEEHEDVGGDWELTTVVVTTSCAAGDIGDEDTWIMRVFQDERQITIDGETDLHGTICGAHFTASGIETLSDFDCSMTLSSHVSGTVDGDSAEGDITNTFQIPDPAACLGFESCSTSFTFTAERL